MHIREFSGNAERPALALHCMMGNASYWRPIASELADLVQITAPDLPGHGRSGDWPGGPPDYHTHITRETAALINRPLDLIGHSVGASVAIRIAVAAPEAVRSLTLIEPVLFAAAPDAADLESLNETSALFAAGNPEQATRRFLEVWGEVGLDEQPAATRARRIHQIGMVVSSNDALIHDSANILREGGLEAIDAPVMLIMGEKSPAIIHTIADNLAARMQDVARATVPDARHMLPITHAGQVTGLIRMNLERA